MQYVRGGFWLPSLFQSACAVLLAAHSVQGVSNGSQPLPPLSRALVLPGDHSPRQRTGLLARGGHFLREGGGEGRRGGGRVNFLFLTLNGLDRPDLWEEFFAGAEGRYRAFMHCKDKGSCKSKADVNKKLRIKVVDSVESYYCSNLVSAMVQLLRAADAKGASDGDRFVFVSQSTLPVKPFPAVHSALTSKASSDFCISKQLRWGHVQLSGGEEAFLVKHSQWIALNRGDAASLLERWPKVKGGLSGYGDMSIPIVSGLAHQRSSVKTKGAVKFPRCLDEWAPFVAINGAFFMDGRPPEPEVLGSVGSCRTFAFWSTEGDRDEVVRLAAAVKSELSCYPECSGTHPAEFASLSDRAAEALAKSSFLFARKFRQGAMSLQQYKRIILGKK